MPSNLFWFLGLFVPGGGLEINWTLSDSPICLRPEVGVGTHRGTELAYHGHTQTQCSTQQSSDCVPAQPGCPSTQLWGKEVWNSAKVWETWLPRVKQALSPSQQAGDPSFVGCVPAKRTTRSKLGFFPLTHRTHSMIFKCFVSQPLSMENRGNQAMIATGSFEERDTFREA